MSWNCEGVAGNTHPSVTNEDGLSCSECGRSQEETQKTTVGINSGSQGNGFIVPVAIAAIILLTGGGIVATQADKIDLLCRPAGNCESFVKAYKTASSLGQDAETGLKNARTIQDLAQANDAAEKSNKTIKSADIPANAPIAASASKLIGTNEDLIKQIITRTAQEQKAEVSLKQAAAKATEADKIKLATTANQSLESQVERLIKQVNLLKQASQIASTIPDTSLLQEKRSAEVKNYGTKIKSLLKELDNLSNKIAAARVPPPIKNSDPEPSDPPRSDIIERSYLGNPPRRLSPGDPQYCAQNPGKCIF